MLAPEKTIPAPPFPTGARWVNVSMLRMDQQQGRPVLVEFFDFCRINSLRTLRYVKRWHERYADAGLRVVSVHSPGFACSRDEDDVRAAIARLEIEHAVLLDPELAFWRTYEVPGWPARYLFDAEGWLVEGHVGEGAYQATERLIADRLGIASCEPIAPLRPDEVPEALIVAQTSDVDGPYRGPYEAGGVHAVLSGTGAARAFGATTTVEHPGCYTLADHMVHTEGVLDLDLDPGVTCHGVCFTPGLAPQQPAGVPAP